MNATVGFVAAAHRPLETACSKAIKTALALAFEAVPLPAMDGAKDFSMDLAQVSPVTALVVATGDQDSVTLATSAILVTALHRVGTAVAAGARLGVIADADPMTCCR
jgi:hypothetical protein